MRIRFSGEVIEWRGPAPYLFLSLPDADSVELRERPELSYGWGCIAVQATIGDTSFETSLMPRDGRYLLPLKVVVQRAEGVDLGDRITATVTVIERG